MAIVKKAKKAQFGALLKSVGKAVDKYSVKQAGVAAEQAGVAAERAAAKAADDNAWKQMRRLDRYERGIIKTPLSKADREIATKYRESPKGQAWIKGHEESLKKYEDAAAERIKAYNAQKANGVKQKNGGVTKAKDGKWIQKAINPKHKGYCTPMTKSTCTPKRKALAVTLKKMAKSRKGK